MRTGRDTNTPELDMNPMVDMAFLLVSFFMLTTTFKTAEPVVVQKPTSVSEIKIPERNIMTITISDEGSIFFGIDNKHVRERLIKKFEVMRGLQFEEAAIETFSLTSAVGVPFDGLTDLLEMSIEDRSAFDQPGIPCGGENNELKEWILTTRLINPSQRVAIVADQRTPYEHIRCVITTLQELKIHRFNLITDLET